MKKVGHALFLALAIAFPSCGETRSSQQPQQPAPVVVEKMAPDVSSILDHVVRIREERIYLITLEFKKEEFTIDIWKLAKNSMAAEKKMLLVGERTYDDYRIGEKVSSQGDGWGFFFNGDIAEYVVRTVDKEVMRQFFWVGDDGSQTEIDEATHDELLRRLQTDGPQLLTVPFAGVVQTYVLRRPLEEYQFVHREQMQRYFVNVHVENSTLTLDLTKHLRNAVTAHDITLEVPQEVYASTSDAWEPTANAHNLFFRGRLSELRGKITKRWSEADPNYQLARTADGEEFIIPSATP